MNMSSTTAPTLRLVHSSGPAADGSYSSYQEFIVEDDSPAPVEQFAVGHTYECRIMGCPVPVKYEVSARSANFVTIVEEGTGKSLRCKVHVSTVDNGEFVYPSGRYSMAPTLSVSREVFDSPKLMLATGWQDSYVRPDGTTTCCDTFSSIGDCGEYCKGCYAPVAGQIGEDGHPLG